MNTSQPILNIVSDIPAALRRYGHGIGISQNAAEQLNACLNHIAIRIIEQAKLLSKYDMTAKGLVPRHRICSAREIQCGVRIALPSELAKFAVSEGTKLVTLASANGRDAAINDISINMNTISEFLNETCGKYAYWADIYFGAVLDYLLAELLELSGNAARDRYSDMIDIRDLKQAVANDSELQQMLSKWNWMGGGVLPYIPGALLRGTEHISIEEPVVPPYTEPILTEEYIASRNIPSRKKVKRASRKKSKRVSRKKKSRRPSRR